jgi:hypothetical protein
MNTDNKYFDHIESYLDGSMSDSERVIFEMNLKKDPELARELASRKKIGSDWTDALAYEKTKEEVASAIRRSKAHGTKRLIWMAAAATLLILVAIPATLFLFQKPFLTNEIAKQAALDSTKELIVTPEIKLPEEKASSGPARTIVHLKPNIHTVISPSDSVVFEWQPGLSHETNLIIEKDREIILSIVVGKNQTLVKINAGALAEGKYFWYFRGFASKDSFMIIP